MLSSFFIFTVGLAATSQASPVPWLSSWISSYNSYVPQSAARFLNETFEDGRDVVYDLYDDVREELINKTSDNVDRITGLFEDMFGDFKTFGSSLDKIEDVDENDETLKKLKELETDIMDDLANDRNVSDDVEKMLQETLTSIRMMINGWAKDDTIDWIEMENFRSAAYGLYLSLDEGSAKLKDEISDLFQTLKQVDLNKIGQEENENFEDDEAVPRRFV